MVEAVLLGVLQGFTEFLPVSSSGHLALAQALLGSDDAARNLQFSVAVHVGSLLAVLVFVGPEIRAMLTTRPRLALVVAVATLPVAAIGFLAQDLVARLAVDLVVVGLCFLGTAALLLLVHRLRAGDRHAERLPLPRALAVGLAQTLALLPGLSRSGATIACGLRVGLRPDHAVRFSFLLAAPAIAGAGLLTALEGGWGASDAGVLAAGFSASFVASLFAMRWLVRLVAGGRLWWFSAYCAAAAAVAIAYGSSSGM